ncbi:UNVERIFIED_CONTAM: hypothetical protein Sradi_1302600 [Sesamum radiatum]|uniref:Uncharacterized protein n=1 Tax=Sesamum radiatum TaxID=300843 RepID=A0AAW2US90_SESRA
MGMWVQNLFRVDFNLLVAEENNQLLLNNHHTPPTGSKPLPENLAALPEANATSSRKGSGRYHGSPRGHSYGRGRGHGGRSRGRDNDRGNHHNTWINPNIQKKNGIKAKNQHEKTTNGDICHRCGMSGHWSHTYRTAQHLVKLYQASLKAKGKEVETNFVEAGILDNTHIDASDFSSPLKMMIKISLSCPYSLVTFLRISAILLIKYLFHMYFF